MVSLAHERDGVAGQRRDADTRRRNLRARDIVPKRLKQPVDTMILLRRAEQHGYDQIAREVLGNLLVDFLLRWNRVLEQLLEQMIVEIGERFEQLAPRGLFALKHLCWNLDQVRVVAG